MSSTEANFSFTTKVDGDLLTVRGNTAEEFVQNAASVAVARAAKAFQAIARDGSLAPARPAPTHQQAVESVVQLVPATVVSDTTQGEAAIDVEEDQWGNRWAYNYPGAPHTGTERGKAVLKTAKRRDGKGYYKKWMDPAKGPRFTGNRNPHDLWEGPYVD